MAFELFVALRYLRGKRKNLFISLITLISISGVSVGVIALIVVMSVMTGFDIALRDTIIGNQSHLTVQDYGGSIEDPDTLIAELEALCPEIVASAPIIQTQALLSGKGPLAEGVAGAFIVGIDPEREQEVTQLADNLSNDRARTYGAGQMPGKKELMLGYILAMDSLGVGIGDMVEVTTLNSKVTPVGIRPGQGLWLTVTGISQAQMSQYDAHLAYVDIPTAKMLTGRAGVDAVHCKVKDPSREAVDKIAERIRVEMGLSTTTWYESELQFFEALKQEKVAMFIILVFIVLVAAFNITSTLIMVVMEKRRDIGILRTLGVSGPSILLLFILLGLLIGVTGTILGVMAGTLLAHNLTPVAEFIAGLFGLDLFNSQIYFFDSIPVAVIPMDIFWITICSIILSLASTLYPAWSATRLDPVEALRYE